MKLPMFLRSVSILGCVLLSGCVAFMPSRPPKNLNMYWEFCHRPEAEREKVFPSLSLKTQLDTYLTCTKYYHPPQLGTAYDFAKNGAEGIKLIVDYLDDTSDEITIRDLVHAMRVMSDVGQYDVANDPTAIKSLRAAISRIPDGQGWVKSYCLENLSEILAKPAKDKQ